MRPTSSRKKKRDDDNIFKIEVIPPKKEHNNQVQKPNNIRNLLRFSPAKHVKRQNLKANQSSQFLSKKEQYLQYEQLSSKKILKTKSSAKQSQKNILSPNKNQQSIFSIKLNQKLKNDRIKKLNIQANNKVGRSISPRPKTPRTPGLNRNRKKSWQQIQIRYPMISINQFMFQIQEDPKENKQKNIHIVFCKQSLQFRKLIYKVQENINFIPIKNQNIIPIYGRTKLHNKIYFIENYIQKSSIVEIIPRYGLPFKQSLLKDKILTIVNAMICLHKREIIHNRISPQTIFIDKKGQFLVDLLASSQLPLKQSQKLKNYYYLSPEILKNGEISPKNDVWSLGCLVLYLCTGNLQSSKLHPYNQFYNRTHSIEQLKVVKELRVKYGKPFTQELQGQRFDDILSDEIKSFINHCLKINPKHRLEMIQLNFNLPFLQV